MSIRVRLIYEKRGGACFVPHVALASVFTRSAFRAGLSLAMTQGFSPRPRISFGPELPAGVVALNEPFEIYLEQGPDDFNNFYNFPEGLLKRWNAAMPEGFRLLRASLPGDGPSLGRMCQAALYWVRCVNKNLSCEALLERAGEYYRGAVLEARAGCDIEENGKADWLSLMLDAPAQNGIGGWIKKMISDGDIDGWQDIHTVRAAIGTKKFKK